MNLNIKIRCDFGKIHGLGHFKRCLNLANDLKKKKIKSTFIINNDKKIKNIIKDNNHKFIIINGEEISINEDVSWNTKKDNVLIFDSRNLNNKYLNRFKYGFKCCFDDNLYRDLNCSILINNNLWIKKNLYSKNSNRKLLVGFKYNTVNDDTFVSKQKRDGLLISFGGEDPDNITLKIIKYIRNYFNSKKIFVILGPYHPDKKSIKDFTKKMNNIKLINNPKNLKPYYDLCNLAITACGTTIYELIASKIPFGYFVIENHQKEFGQYIGKKKLGFNIGNYKNSEKTISNNLYKFSISKHNKFLKNYQKYYNKSGLKNISSEIIKFANK